MSLDVAVDVRESSQVPLTPEKRKWGFHVQRDIDSVNTLARFITLGSTYQSLYELTQRQCQTIQDLKGRKPQDIRSQLKQDFPQGFSDTVNMDERTYLTNLTDVFDFLVGEKKGQRKKVRLSNFSDLDLTDDQLFEFADALGEINKLLGKGIMDHFSDIVIIPHGHPILWGEEQANTRAVSILDNKMIVINANYLNPKAFKVHASEVPGERPDKAATNLKGLLLHEFAHLWADTHQEELKQYEANTLGETPPTKYAERIDHETGRRIEDLPETLTSYLHPTYVSNIGPVHAREFESLIADTSTRGPDKDDNEVTDEVTCRQVNPEAIVKLSTALPRTDRNWLKPWLSTEPAYTQATIDEFKGAALAKLEAATDKKVDPTQDSGTRSTKIGHFVLPDGNILRVTHLVVDNQPDGYPEDTVVYPREDIIVEVISNKPNAKGVYQSEGLRVTSRKEDYAKTHLQWVTAGYKKSEGSDSVAFEPIPEVNQYKIDFVSKPPNNNNVKEIMQLLQ